jgi:dsDNA-binding SOS-regulon protein
MRRGDAKAMKLADGLDLWLMSAPRALNGLNEEEIALGFMADA